MGLHRLEAQLGRAVILLSLWLCAYGLCTSAYADSGADSGAVALRLQLHRQASRERDRRFVRLLLPFTLAPPFPLLGLDGGRVWARRE